MNVIIADDHPSIRIGLRAYLGHRGLQVVGEAVDADQTIQLLTDVECDVLVTDFLMPCKTHSDAFDYLDDIHTRWPNLPVVVITMVSRRATLQRIRASGAVGLVDKAEPMERLASATRMALSGRSYVSPSIRALLQTPGGTLALPSIDETNLLTPRERHVLQLLGMGMNASDAAEMLGRSVTTISSHKRSLMSKLKLRDDREINEYLRNKYQWQARRS